MHFLPRSTPLELSADRLRGLRLSLNTPVVSIEDLPAEPARAAIAVHDEFDGSPNITVGVYPLRSGVPVLFSFEGGLRDQSALANGIDAALSFGESMGFLFDEDELESCLTEEARSRALDLWRELIVPASGESNPAPRPSVEPAAPPSAPDESFAAELLDDEVLLLEEVADPDDDPSGVHAEESGEVDSASPVSLSKFRNCAPSQSPSQSPSPRQEEVLPNPEESPPVARRAALGRLKLAKRRKDGGDAPSRPSAIRRLLSSF
jgi:hypothetical protein